MLDELETRTGYRFKDPSLLRQALTHRSHARQHNERLEFLGDAVLGLFVTEALYRHHPEEPEGQLSKRRAALVCAENLAAVARNLDLGSLLFMGTGEAQSGGRDRQSNLANALEALVAAVYLDGGAEACRLVVDRLFAGTLGQAGPVRIQDAKTRLQEYLQARQQPLPAYRVVSRTGQEHQASFRVACEVPGLGIRAEAEGPNMKKAGQSAAAAVLTLLEGSAHGH